MTPKTLFSVINRWYIQLAILILAVGASYYHSLDVPFYLDDFSSIQENPVIYNWQGTLQELWNFAPLRIIGYLTFALDYQIHHFDVMGYHLVNIVIHLLTGIAVWGLLRGLMRTPALAEILPQNAKNGLPLLAALIFVLHPLQVQAVTYIVQRLASLAALFYIASMASFLQARLAHTMTPRLLWTIACILLALLAFFTKQNTVTLPLALLLLEFVFFPKSWLYIAKVAIGVFATIIVTGLIIVYVFQQHPFSLEAMQALTKETTTISRESYLYTQFNVLWTYIRLFFIPVGLHIDYDYPITNSLLYDNPSYHIIAKILHSEVLWGMLAHLVILAVGIFSIRRFPLLAFSILFYYLAHLVESSVIPIKDVVFEHRTYLPNLGLVTLCAWLITVYLVKIHKMLALTVTVALIATLGTATWLRNEQWRDPIALWQYNVQQSPNKSRAWVILGKHLIQAGKPKEGIEALRHSVTRTTAADGTTTTTYSIETILNMVVAYKMMGEYTTALTWIDQALQGDLNNFNRAKFLVNQGNIFYEQKRLGEAEQSYRHAIAMYPPSLSARANLASILGTLGRNTEAEALYLEILKIDPGNTVVQENLAKLRGLSQ
jgi:Flp pilus assembly protein TadD